MDAKLFATVLGLVLVLPMASSSSQARLFGPRLHYAPVVVRALFDSCWRYRQSREPERIWTCGNYVKPNADFDWGYGTSIGDRAGRYGYW
jgi:hypothetical protein